MTPAEEKVILTEVLYHIRGPTITTTEALAHSIHKKLGKTKMTEQDVQTRVINAVVFHKEETQ